MLARYPSAAAVIQVLEVLVRPATFSLSRLLALRHCPPVLPFPFITLKERHCRQYPLLALLGSTTLLLQSFLAHLSTARCLWRVVSLSVQVSIL